MTYRIRRKFTSSTFEVDGQLCKVVLDPLWVNTHGGTAWNVGFAVGKSRRQLNDWYNERKNRRARSVKKHMNGKSGMKAIIKGFEEVLRLRWVIEPGDCIIFDCTSAHPEKQFRAWSRWMKYHPDLLADPEKLEFYWFRPPYLSDPLWDSYRIIPQTPANPLESTAGRRYYDCFLVDPLPSGKTQSS